MEVTPQAVLTVVSALLCVLAAGSIPSHPVDLNYTQIRIGHTLNVGEKDHVTRRRLTVQQCLRKLNIPTTLNKVPNIALLSSGGGQRAMVGLLASVLQLEEEGLLDCMMYLSGVSGSTWGMSSLYQHPNWSSNLKNVTKKIIDRLDGCGVLLRYPDKWNQYDNFNQAHGWAAHVVTAFVKEIDEGVLSDQRGKHDSDPYPIYTVIDKEIKDRGQLKSLKDVWVEMTPHEAGYSLGGAFVDQKYFGSKFDNGVLVKKQPEMDMLYVQGLCGSIAADLSPSAAWSVVKRNMLCLLGNLFAGLMKPTFHWGTTYNFLYNMRSEVVPDVDPCILKSGTRDYIDAGLLLNSAYFSVLRPERKVDLIISMDFSEGDPMLTIEDAYKLAKDMRIAFPRVTFPEHDREEPKDIYVFPGDDRTPTVIHMPLFNRVNCHVSDGCSLEKMRLRYRTLQGPLCPAKIKELMDRAAANVVNTRTMLLEEIRKAVNRKKP